MLPITQNWSVDSQYVRHGSCLRNPVVWANLLADKLRWEFRKQEGAVEDCHAIVVIIRCQLEIILRGLLLASLRS